MHLDDQLRLETRNLPLLQEMVQADQIVCPTEWQRQQFPVFIRDRIRVIFDGVDQEFFRPAPPVNPLILGQHDDNPIQFTPDQLLLTYGTRGMEPLRGFPEFMRAAAAHSSISRSCRLWCLAMTVRHTAMKVPILRAVGRNIC